jgi:hypothetical protein
MPTTESAAAFAKLVQTRTHLNQLSCELRKALESRGLSAFADEQYRQLQKRWDEAFAAFKQAVQEFSVTVAQIPAEGLVEFGHLEAD